MTTVPDLKVFLDDLTIDGDQTVFHWTLQGTNAGTGGTGKRVRISGFEKWRIGVDGLIAESKGHFDSDEYQRQIEHGVDDPR
jgi:predicted ester cyclase